MNELKLKGLKKERRMKPRDFLSHFALAFSLLLCVEHVASTTPTTQHHQVQHRYDEEWSLKTDRNLSNDDLFDFPGCLIASIIVFGGALLCAGAGTGHQC